MDKKTIYLIRHGETEYNRKGAVQGRGIDAELNETGQRQARAFYEKYRDVPFQKIYVSSLRRTYQTSQGFIDTGIPYERLERLDEISWGKVEGMTLEETGYEMFKSLIEKWREGETHAALDGGESPEQVVTRQEEVIRTLLERKEEKLILVTMHGRAMRILLSRVLGFPLWEMDRFEHSNTCLYILEYDYSREQFEVKLSNDISHIREHMDEEHA
ncbi:MAG: histidine phosphatase family protein [Leadbetterella sp.]|nr:histidine phosphatase family protein [Leadbetterella sp.]